MEEEGDGEDLLDENMWKCVPCLEFCNLSCSIVSFTPEFPSLQGVALVRVCIANTALWLVSAYPGDRCSSDHSCSSCQPGIVFAVGKAQAHITNHSYVLCSPMGPRDVTYLPAV